MAPLPESHWLELKLPPVLLVAIAAGLIFVSPAFSFLPLAPKGSLSQFSELVQAVSITLMLMGVLIAIAGVLQFRRHQTTVNPVNPHDASSLVTTGIYRHTRNPMYLGMLISLLGWTMWWLQPLGLVVVALFTYYMTRFQIVPEERALVSHFGHQFAAYCQRTRRWL